MRSTEQYIGKQYDEFLNHLAEVEATISGAVEHQEYDSLYGGTRVDNADMYKCYVDGFIISI